MSFNDCDDLLSTTRDNRSNYYYYSQLGAPTLIYEGDRDNHSGFPVTTTNSISNKHKKTYETFKKQYRVKARWQYGLDMEQIGRVVVPYLGPRKRKLILVNTKSKSCDDLKRNEGDEIDVEFENICDITWMDHHQGQNRLAMLLEDDTQILKHMKCIENHRAYEHPYTEVELENSYHNGETSVYPCKEPKIGLATYSNGQEFSIHRNIDSDPSYLAPFDIESIGEPTTNNSHVFIENTHNEREKLPQGNTLLCIPCPCPSCSEGKHCYILLHPKGSYMERLCISNVTPPLLDAIPGGMKNVNFNTISKRKEFHWNAISSKPNEICLDDTILEIRQCGTWTVANQQCIFPVRTSTHISVIKVICSRPDLLEQQRQPFPSSSCWGCYILEEKERLDLRSLSLRLPSFHPVALTAHPRYGNELSLCKFAFVSHSVGSPTLSTYNVVHSCTFGTERVALTKHDILNLKYISYIDFSDRNPMCLWSAASSYVRPALAPGAISKMQRSKKSPFGLGNSLFAIDLRINSATFQWSPSAEEMTTEGVHSINGILTDWFRENTVFVTSRSAGKTYEIDGRMPCKAVNTWSLTSICDDSRGITLPTTSFYGEPCLLFKPPVQHDGTLSKSNKDIDSPLLRVDTDFRANGIHCFQRPSRKPRFQTCSSESTGMVGLNTTHTASMGTSSYYDLNEVLDNTFPCGLSSIRLPLNQFVGANESDWDHCLEQKLHILCTIIVNNRGDIYCHSMLEGKDERDSLDCCRFNGLPVGTGAIIIPNEIDGRTKYSKNGHWKPNGGMSLSLFLSNTYPVPRTATIATLHEDVEIGLEKNSHVVFLTPSKKIRVDESADVTKIGERTPKSDLTIVNGDRNGYQNQMLQKNGKDHTLIMPLALSLNIEKNTVFRDNRNDDCDVYTNLSGRQELEREKRPDRTDISHSMIKDTLGNWEETSSGPE